MTDPDTWGVAERYEDYRGNWRNVPDTTVRSIMRTMGSSQRPEPPGLGADTPVVVARAGEPTGVAGGPWLLETEDGGSERVTSRLPADLPPGYHQLRRAADGHSALLVVSPGRCYLPADLRTWGWAVQLYATRSRTSWGIGDLGDLRRLAQWSRGQGAGMGLLNPLHAVIPGIAQQASPYFPSSRCFRNPIYLRIEEVPGTDGMVDDLAAAGRALNDNRRIDRDEVWRLKQAALQRAWPRFRDRGGDAGFDRYRDEQGAALDRFAVYCVLSEQHGSPWSTWPARLRRPDSTAVARFAAEHRDRIRFHQWLQWLVEQQLTAAGTALDLMQDLAIGVAPGGADTWQWQDAFALDMRVGAPPDEFNTQGQDWGLPPFDPWQLRLARYEPYIRTLRAGFRSAGGLRFDHVMGLFRLYWIPADTGPAGGTYVRYQWREMLDILALESMRAQAYVVGEDLGTVEDMVRDELAARDVLSYRLLWFEDTPPQRFPRQALAAVTTHDLPTIAGLWSGRDLAEQRALDLKPNEKSTEDIRSRLGRWVGLDGDEQPDEVVVQTHELLAQAPSRILNATLDDALAVVERPNVPGTIDERPNWSLALPVPLEDIETDARVAAIGRALGRPRRAPLSTYRVQLTPDFGFAAAAGIAGYLAELGVSHLYASPYLQAAPGSRHGYDVVDHTRVNAELGGERGHAQLRAALQAAGLGQILDIVPNHMAIGVPGNAWWWDVLENGRASAYATYFDIDWDPPEPKLRGKVLLPILGDHYGRVLQAGDITLRRNDGRFTIHYFEHILPVAPESLDAVPEEVEQINADPGALGSLLDRQHYRLAFWQTASQDLNYRRFFDINTLIGLRIENPDVFAATHQRILDWVRDGTVDGLRIDHPDGLRDPEKYLNRLAAATGRVWVVVEKILESGERLPPAWATAGTTGYDFLNRLTGLFVDPAGEAPLTELYRELTGEPTDYQQVVIAKKHQVLRDVLGADLNRLTALFVQVCERHPRHRDYTRAQLSEALREVIASFPVYRSYLRGPQCPIDPQDQAHITGAIADAAAQRPGLDPDLFGFLGDLLLLRTDPAPELPELELVLRFQQLTGPVMAKGVEDTAFYTYNRFVALNDVGGDPGRFGLRPAEFHQACQEAYREWPTAMLASSTHDTKRSEDVRARLVLLSEMPSTWAQAVRRWAAHNERHRVAGWPDRNAEYLLYQVLVGAWPLPAERATAYMEKAAKEAKQHTSWTEPNPTYDEALGSFTKAVLADEEFSADLAGFVSPLVWPGRVTSLAQTLIKLTVPGVPDIYRGTELWDLSLVDPDNRRPVNYDQRRALLATVRSAGLEEILARTEEGLPKLFVVHHALQLRRERPAAFLDGTYDPLRTAGAHADRVVAFSRSGQVVTVTPRLVLGLADGWDGTTVTLPPGRWHDRLSGQDVDGGTVAVRTLLGRFPVALLETR